MIHPFFWLPSQYRWLVLAVLFVGAALFAVKLAAQGKPLRTSAAPDGILSYEFAWNATRAEQILSSWVSMKSIARQQLYVDFGFIVFYPLLFSLACAMLSESQYDKMAVVGVFISWAMLIAGLLDCVENVALLRMIETGASQFWARLAALCAGSKFLIIYSGLGYLILQGLSVLVSKIRA